MSNNDNDNIRLKKGPWSSHEDALLKEYVRKYGEGNWDAVIKKTDLFRCGKSCRLRWLNHLHPDLKKGSITKEEEQKIVELHAKIGPKWSLMVQELPGRTDNEIKNFWNIRTRKRTKLGLPLYNQIIKPHNDELNANGECTLSNQEQADVSQVDKSKTDIFSRKRPSVSNEFEQLSNSFHVSITQPHFSNMLCNNVANTSIKNNASPTLTNMDGTPFMTKATESDLPQFQGCDSKCSKIVEELPGRRGNEIIKYQNIRTKKRVRASLPLYDQIINLCECEWNDINGETCLDGLSNQHQADVSQVHKSDIHGSNFEQLSNSFHFSNMQPPNVSNMLYNNLACTASSISNNNTSPTLISRGGTPFMTMAMESNLPPLPEAFESPKSVNVSNMPTSNHNFPTLLDRDGTSFTTAATKSVLSPFPECLDFQSSESQLHSYSLIHKYPLLPLRSPMEIPHQLFDTPTILEDSNANKMHSSETRLVDENGKKPISLEKDELNQEDLIDSVFNLGWLDGFIF